MSDGGRDVRVDAYIAARADFARPILTELRARLHTACPDAVETIRWSMPFFDYRGRPLANMAAFTGHAAFGFWRVRGGGEGSDVAMGQFGKLTALDDLPPPDPFAAMVRAAMARSGEAPPPAKPARPDVSTPAELVAAFAEDAASRGHWEAFPPSARRDYVAWIEEAKRPQTRSKRLAVALDQIAGGKRLNWQY